MGSFKSKIMKLKDHSLDRLSFIEVDVESLDKMGIDRNINSLCAAPSAIFYMHGYGERGDITAAAWHSHFKHLILAMPALIEAAAKICDACNKNNLIELVPEYEALCDALQPYKDIL